MAAPLKKQSKATATGATKSLSSMGLETFVMTKVHRSQLVGAPYNPRIINDAEKKKLRNGLKKHGLVTPITWNKRTGHIVGGHQRIGQLDALAGTSDYELDVAALDVAEGAEKEINILLNNYQAMGDWDLNKLGEMVKEAGFDVAGAGFDEADIYSIFGDTVQIHADQATVELLADQLNSIQTTFQKMETGDPDSGGEFYMVVVFRTSAQMEAFVKAGNLQEGRYQNGEDIIRLSGLTEVVENTTPGKPQKRKKAAN